MTEIQNSKQLAFDLICNLVLVICYFRFIRVRIGDSNNCTGNLTSGSEMKYVPDS